MKNSRLTRSVVLAILLTIAMIGNTLNIFAGTVGGTSNDDIRVEATRNADNNTIVISLIANKENSFGGIGFFYTLDDKTSFVKYNANTTTFNGSREHNRTKQHIGLSGSELQDEEGNIVENITDANTTIVSITVAASDFQTDTDYTFSFKMDMAYQNDDDLTDFSWDKDNFSVTYRENTVSFDLNGGDSAAIPDQIVVSGEKATKPENNPTREGYTFKYWAKDGEEFDFSTPITEKTQLVAEWEEDAKTYTLNYNMSGGTNGPEDETKESKGSSVDFTVSDVKPTKNNYDFLGWADTNNATEAAYQAGDTITVTSNDANQTKTIYAVWKLKEYTVKFVDGDGNEIISKTYPYGTEAADITVPETATKSSTDEYDYTFKGWDSEIKKVTGDATYTATFDETKRKYTITWKDENGDVIDTTEVEYGETPTHDEPTKKNPEEGKTYTFDGWTPAVSGVTGEATYTAKFKETANSYTVKFIDGDGNEIISKTYPYGTEAADITVPETATKTSTDEYDYTFKGWDSEIKKVTGDATYTATFDAVKKKYTVTWKNEDGTVLETDTDVEYGADPSYDGTEPTKAASGNTSYKFVGWTPSVSPVKGDATYTATFADSKNYTITTKEEGHTYEVYQIFTGDIATLNNKDVLTNLVLGQNGKLPVNSTIDDAVAALKEVGDEVTKTDKEQLAVITQYVDLDGEAYKTVKSENGSAVNLTDIPGGYYLIKDKDGSQDEDGYYTLYITKIIKDYTIKPKSSKPTVEKGIIDGNSPVQTADYAIGDDVQFQLTAKIPKDVNLENYTKYTVKFTDTMSAGLTYRQIDSVKVGDHVVSEGASGYTVSTKTVSEGTELTLSIADVKAIANDTDELKGDIDVVVRYTAKLNENAKATSQGGNVITVADNVNTNKVKLEYSNNPNADHEGDTGEITTEDIVWVFTYKIDGKKIEKDTDNPLGGAEFKLYKKGTDSNTEIKLAYDSTNEVYYPAADGSATLTSAETTGAFNIVGLDAGNYVLSETKAPDGYNKCADQEFEIAATHEENPDLNTVKLTLTGVSSVTVENSKGNELPTTGGIGTTIFYVVGGILVIGAGVILITRRRMSE